MVFLDLMLNLEHLESFLNKYPKYLLEVLIGAFEALKKNY
jgi:hypothetical protein